MFKEEGASDFDVKNGQMPMNGVGHVLIGGILVFTALLMLGFSSDLVVPKYFISDRGVIFHSSFGVFMTMANLALLAFIVLIYISFIVLYKKTL